SCTTWTVTNPGPLEVDPVTTIPTYHACNDSADPTTPLYCPTRRSSDLDPINATDPITGTAEPGSTVTVTFPDDTTATVVADSNGDWTVPNPGLTDGDTVTAITTDPAGNDSTEATTTVDGVAPAAPVIDPINATDPID